MTTDLTQALTQRLRALPPPERQAAPGGLAWDLTALFGESQAESAQAAFQMVFQWLAATAAEPGLLLLGEGRGLRRYPGEPLETFRARVVGAFEYWEMAGTRPGMELALLQAGYRAQIIEHYADPDLLRPHEFSVIVTPAQRLPADGQWSGAGVAWGGDTAWGYRLPAVPLGWLPDLIREVKPAHARLRRLTFYPRGRFWGGDLAWGEGRDEAPAAPQPGWGLQSGFQGVVPYPERSDSGPTWGESDAEVIYELEGAPDA
ncbi:phage tail protein [uncultured Deinococcus sp.]|uniref:phage tail protein n=1 Tax=uncultured Deinococcus sp. TaxID=158789 RepID=UPI002583985C|nr:phage tail protein [uncultured Deinococcus sp.]